MSTPADVVRDLRAEALAALDYLRLLKCGDVAAESTRCAGITAGYADIRIGDALERIAAAMAPPLDLAPALEAAGMSDSAPPLDLALLKNVLDIAACCCDKFNPEANIKCRRCRALAELRRWKEASR